MKKVAGISLGCKENTYETGAVQSCFAAKGYLCVGEREEADVYLLNTCAVTHTGEQKCRQLLHSLRRAHPSAVICAMGCYCQIAKAPETVFADADIIVGVRDRTRLPELVEQFLSDRKKICLRGENRHLSYETMKADRLTGHDRAIIKIQEGCNRFCTYCVIPYARGNPRSRPLSEIRDEADALAKNGYREVVLSGTNLSLYGADLKEGETLLSSVRAIAETEGIERIRLGSLEPPYLLRLLSEGLANEKKLCPHFHLSLQSGSDTVLSRMNRRYTAAECAEAMRQTRKHLPRVLFSADIICGFPGETEAEFKETENFIRDNGFLKVHVFPYSQRSGTAAERMPGQLQETIKRNRVSQLTSVAVESEEKALSAFVGKEVSVIVESKPKTVCEHKYAFGFSAEYAKVLLPLSFLSQKNSIVSVFVTSVQNGYLLAQ